MINGLSVQNMASAVRPMTQKRQGRKSRALLESRNITPHSSPVRLFRSSAAFHAKNYAMPKHVNTRSPAPLLFEIQNCACIGSQSGIKSTRKVIVLV